MQCTRIAQFNLLLDKQIKILRLWQPPQEGKDRLSGPRPGPQEGQAARGQALRRGRNDGMASLRVTAKTPAKTAATTWRLTQIATAAALFACGLSRPATAQGARSGGHLTVGLAQDPPIVDPIRTGSFTERQFATGIYESLFDIDEKGQPVPFLAESFTVSDDVKTYAGSSCGPT